MRNSLDELRPSAVCSLPVAIATSDGKENSVKKVRQKNKKRKVSSAEREVGTVPYPADLPKLPYALSEIVKKGNILVECSEFIQFWADHLMSLTSGKPIPADYTNFAETIVDTYPVLAGGESGYVSHWNEHFTAFVKYFET